MNSILFQAYRINGLTLRNRMVMAPMAGNRADLGGVPTLMMATYYAQRASAGLIVSEATQVSARANGYLYTPGIYTKAQRDAWRPVTRAVHQAKGRIFSQLWHAGRVSHTSLQPDGEAPVAPSAINAESQVLTADGFVPTSTPTALSADEIPMIVDQYSLSAEFAKQAGFDGVEIHAGNGYLIDQFLKDGSNQRNDDYGGDVTARIRFAVEVVKAVTDVWGNDLVGFRISPRGTFNGMRDSNPQALFSALAEELEAFSLAYLHVIEPLSGHDEFEIQEGTEPVAPLIRKKYSGRLILNGGYDKYAAELALNNDEADLIALGVPFWANPVWVERLQQDTELHSPERFN